MKSGKTENNEGGKAKSFKSQYINLAENYFSLGATEKQVSGFFGIDESTLKAWEIKYPKLKDAIKRGRIMADAKIAHSLFRRCIGYSYVELHEGTSQGKVTLTKLTKHKPPDVRACIHWLCNRQPKLWKNVTGVEFEDGGDID